MIKAAKTAWLSYEILWPLSVRIVFVPWRHRDGTAVVVTGSTGSGKTWRACALAQPACRRGHPAPYLHVLRLAEDVRVLHGNGGFGRWLAAVARTDVLLLYDWGAGHQGWPDSRGSAGGNRRPGGKALDDRDEPESPKTSEMRAGCSSS